MLQFFPRKQAKRIVDRVKSDENFYPQKSLQPPTHFPLLHSDVGLAFLCLFDRQNARHLFDLRPIHTRDELIDELSK